MTNQTINQSLAAKENNCCSLGFKFQLELDGINKEFVSACSFPSFNLVGDREYVAISSNHIAPPLGTTDIFAQFYFAAAPAIIDWMYTKNSEGLPARRNGSLTIFKNDDTPFVVFNLVGCELRQLDFGTSNYKNQEPLVISVSFRTVAKVAIAE